MHRGNPAANPMPATAVPNPIGSVVVPSDAAAVGCGVVVATGAVVAVDDPPERDGPDDDAATIEPPQPTCNGAGIAMAALAAWVWALSSAESGT